MKVAVVGVTGYSGQILYQLLMQHPEIDAINLYGHQDTEGDVRQLGELVPALNGLTAPIMPFNADEIMATCDAIFFATPAGVTKELALPMLMHDFPAIDLSGDFRLSNPASYEQWYHQTPASQGLDHASYNLADLSQPTTNYVANPGCYATATLLALAPLVQGHLIDVNSIVIDAKSGLSGAGKQLSPTSHYVAMNENLQTYKVNQHQHIPEIVQQLQQWDATIQGVQFSTTLVPLTRGIMASVYAKATQPVTTAELEAYLTKFYAQQASIHVTPGRFPSVQEVSHANLCKLGIAFNPATQTISVCAVIDNLMKGAAGQAVQNFNHLFKLPVDMGLPLFPQMP